MEDESQIESTRENSSYSQVTIDGKLLEMAVLMDSKFENMMNQIQLLLPRSPPENPRSSPENTRSPSASLNFQENDHPIPLNTPSNVQIPMSTRPSRHTRHVQHEDANFRHRFQQDNTTQNDLPIGVVFPLLPTWILITGKTPLFDR
jgi:hypothetical protein